MHDFLFSYNCGILVTVFFVRISIPIDLGCAAFITINFGKGLQNEILVNNIHTYMYVHRSMGALQGASNVLIANKVRERGMRGLFRKALVEVIQIQKQNF